MNVRRYTLLAATIAVLFLAGAPAALAAPFTVDTSASGTGDTAPGDGLCEDGLVGTQCTLGAAVTEANFDATPDTIGFSAAITQPLNRGPVLAITQPLTIDGCSSKPNHAGPCTDVHNLSNTEAINVSVPGVTIRGLALTGSGTKIVATAAADNLVIKNNWFGIALDGGADGDPTVALDIRGDGATIGGTGGATGASPADRNVISNHSTGIRLSGDNATVQGNFIGTRPAGNDGQGNTGLTFGIRVADESNTDAPTGTLIGGTANATEVSTAACDGPCNVISHSLNGIALDNESLPSLTTFASATTIRGNYIGTDATGTQDIGNNVGIAVGRAGLTQIGGTSVGDRNLIAGSDSTFLASVHVAGGDDTTIQGNRFGVGSAGEAIPNAGPGIGFSQFSPSDQAVGGQVGGDTVSAENVISNSGKDAINIRQGAGDITIARNTGNSNGSGLAGDEFIDLESTGNGGINAPVITKATTASVTGIGAASGATIRLFATKGEHGDISKFLGSTTAASNGFWQFNYGGVVVKPGQRIAVTQTVPQIGDDTSELTGVVRTGNDTAAPTVFIEEGPAANSTTTDNTPTFRFSSNMPAATFECHYDAAGFASCPTPFTGPTPLGDGTHTLSVRARVGVDVGSAIGRTFTVDATAETVITAGPTATNDTTPTFEFSSPDAGATFKCKFDAGSFAPCSGPGNSHTPTTPLTDGLHTFKVKATDAFGNVDQTPATRNVTIDTVVPDTTITSGPAAGSSTKDATPTFGFSSNEAGATFECKIDAAAFGPCSGPGAKHTPAALADGQHTFRVRALDAAGNVDGSPGQRNFVVDTVRPQTTITSGPAAGSTTADPTPTFGFSSSDAGSTFECRVDGGAFGPCSGPGAKHTTAALADGQHSFRVRATDLAGNVDDTADIRTFEIDAP